MKFNHSDSVTCTINGTIITDAKISIDSDGTSFICQNKCVGASAKNKLGYKYSWTLSYDFKDYLVTDLQLARPHTIDDIQVGNLLVDECGVEHPVLMRIGEVVLLGYKQDYGYSAGENYTIAELKNIGYTLKQPEVTTPVPTKLTVAQIAEKLGYEVEIVKEG